MVSPLFAGEEAGGEGVLEVGPLAAVGAAEHEPLLVAGEILGVDAEVGHGGLAEDAPALVVRVHDAVGDVLGQRLVQLVELVQADVIHVHGGHVLVGLDPQEPEGDVAEPLELRGVGAFFPLPRPLGQIGVWVALDHELGDQRVLVDDGVNRGRHELADEVRVGDVVAADQAQAAAAVERLPDLQRGNPKLRRLLHHRLAGVVHHQQGHELMALQRPQPPALAAAADVDVLGEELQLGVRESGIRPAAEGGAQLGFGWSGQRHGDHHGIHEIHES